MKQFRFPDQPQKKPSSAEIRAFVKDRLHGFKWRQQNREKRRERKRERKPGTPATPRPPKQEKEEPRMKSPIVFAADFEGPKAALNPMAIKVPGPIHVEIYQARAATRDFMPEWRARNNQTRFQAIAGQTTPKALQEQIELHFFEKRLTDWVALDSQDWPTGSYRQLTEGLDFYFDSNGNPFLKKEYLEARHEEMIRQTPPRKQAAR